MKKEGFIAPFCYFRLYVSNTKGRGNTMPPFRSKYVFLHSLTMITNKF